MGIVILGGGISGLTAAFYLRQYGYKCSIKILEGTDRVGGWINSHRNENGTIFELGPRTLKVGGNAAANTLMLAETLGLEKEIIPIADGHPATRVRMIQVGGKLHTLPNSIVKLFIKTPPFSKSIFRMCLKDLQANKITSADESLYSFIERRLGTEIATYIIDPLARGIFAGDARKLSVLSFARPLFEAEQNYGSIIKGLVKKAKVPIDPEISKCMLANKADKEWSSWSLAGGLETLVNSLCLHLEDYDIEIIKNAPVKEISFKNQELSVVTDINSTKADHVISCLPLYQLKNIVSSLNENLSSILGSVPYVTVAVVNLEFNTKVLSEPAFGYLVPSSESSKVLGVIFDTCTFPQEDKTVFTVMMGGSWFDEHFGHDISNEKLYQIAVEEVKKTLKISVEPSCFKVSVLKNCIPQYTIGHFERMKNVQELISSYPLHIAGQCINGVGVNDSIYTSKQLVKSLSETFA